MVKTIIPQNKTFCIEIIGSTFSCKVNTASRLCQLNTSTLLTPPFQRAQNIASRQEVEKFDFLTDAFNICWIIKVLHKGELKWFSISLLEEGLKGGG